MRSMILAAVLVMFAATGFAADKPVLSDINTATKADIDAVDGIGPKYAARIIDAREKAGGKFKSMKELQDVKGVGDKMFEKLACSFQVPAEGPLPCSLKMPVKASDLVNLNTGDVKALDGLPGMGKKKAELIIKHRTEKGPYLKPGDLDQVKGFGPKTIEKLVPFVCVEVDINNATVEDFTALGFVNAADIVKFRTDKGPFGQPVELGKLPGVDEKVFKAVEPILVVKAPKAN